MKKRMTLSLFLSFQFCSYAQSTHKLLMWGNTYYAEKDYDKAQLTYKDALTKDESSIKANYNLGNALYKQRKYNESISYYQQVATNTEDAYLQSKAHYNIGNAHLQEAESIKEKLEKKSEVQEGSANASPAQNLPQKMYETYTKAKDAYIDALKKNPQDYDAKNNLAYTQRILNKILEREQPSPQDEQTQEQQSQPPQENQQQEKSPSDTQNQDSREIKENDLQRLMKIIDDANQKVQKRLMERLDLKQSGKPQKEW